MIKEKLKQVQASRGPNNLISLILKTIIFNYAKSKAKTSTNGTNSLMNSSAVVKIGQRVNWCCDRCPRENRPDVAVGRLCLDLNLVSTILFIIKLVW